MPHTAAHCPAVCWTATYCSKHCHTLPHSATCTAAHLRTHCRTLPDSRTLPQALPRTATRIATHSCTAAHCHTLPHTATVPHTVALPHTAAHCRIAGLPDSTLPASTATHCHPYRRTLHELKCHSPYTAHRILHTALNMNTNNFLCTRIWIYVKLCEFIWIYMNLHDCLNYLIECVWINMNICVTLFNFISNAFVYSKFIQILTDDILWIYSKICTLLHRQTDAHYRAQCWTAARTAAHYCTDARCMN
jgi:hypothetical protein